MSHEFQPMDLLSTSRKRRPSTLDIIGGHIREMEAVKLKSGKIIQDLSEETILSKDNEESQSPILQEQEDQLESSVYNLLRSYLISPEMNQESLDVQIEQAMDMMKTILKTTVRSEFCKYQNKIVRLEEIAEQLQHENKLLRNYVDSEVISQLEQDSFKTSFDSSDNSEDGSQSFRE